MAKKSENTEIPDSKIIPFETILRCKLTAEELMARGNEMAEASAEIATLEDTIASVKKEYQAKIDAKQARINELTATIMSKSESRIIKCERSYLFNSGKVVEKRTDTGEEINVRDMRDEERQMDMGL